MKYLVGIDRDGTINVDDCKYFGSEPDWMDKLTFCRNSVEGLRKLTNHADIYTVVISNQEGVAKGVFTEDDVKYINRYMDLLLRTQDVYIDGWYFCPFTTRDHADSWEKRGHTAYRKDYITDSDLKNPKTGMLKQAASDLGMSLEDFASIYVIGDRATDVECGLNAGGLGILVNGPEEERFKVNEMRKKASEYHRSVAIVDDLLRAAEYVLMDIAMIELHS